MLIQYFIKNKILYSFGSLHSSTFRLYKNSLRSRLKLSISLPTSKFQSALLFLWNPSINISNQYINTVSHKIYFSSQIISYRQHYKMFAFDFVVYISRVILVTLCLFFAYKVMFRRYQSDLLLKSVLFILFQPENQSAFNEIMFNSRKNAKTYFSSVI